MASSDISNDSNSVKLEKFSILDNNVLKVFAANGIEADNLKSAQHAKDGVISAMHFDKSLGFLIADHPLDHGFKNVESGDDRTVFFYFNKIRNIDLKPVELEVGTRIKFVLNLKSMNKPKALYLLVASDFVGSTKTSSEENFKLPPPVPAAKERREDNQHIQKKENGQKKTSKKSAPKRRDAKAETNPSVQLPKESAGPSSVKKKSYEAGEMPGTLMFHTKTVYPPNVLPPKETVKFKANSEASAAEAGPSSVKKSYEAGEMPGTMMVYAKTFYPPNVLPFKEKLKNGQIRHLHVDKEFGFIKTPLDPTEDDVLFYFNKVKNVSEKDVKLGPDSTVQYCVDGTTKDGKPKVVLVEVNLESAGEKDIKLKCGHVVKKQCHERESEIFCNKKCGKNLSGCRHQCQELCGLPHLHNECSKWIRYRFPKCGHDSPKRKHCSEKITWPCKTEVVVKESETSCGHTFKKKCEEKPSCSMPCKKSLVCGHPCSAKCGQPCTSRECKLCLDLVQNNTVKAEKEALEEFEKKKKELHESIKERAKKGKIRVENLSKHGETAAEYQMVEDHVVKFIVPCHNWTPMVYKVERVINLDLEEKFELARLKSFDEKKFCDFKFHGTSQEAVDSIVREGFRMPRKTGMYGKGLYFATDSSKSAQEQYTKGSEKLLMCKLLIGKSMIVTKSDNSITQEVLRRKQFDSVFAPRGTKASGGVMNDEYVIYNPEHALPMYIIHYSTKGLAPQAVLMSAAAHTPTERYLKRNMKASREINTNDPWQVHFKLAEGHFLCMLAAKNKVGLIMGHQNANCKIDSIDVVVNKDLEEKFEAKAKEFQRSGVKHHPILAFHGTKVENIDSIIKTNLNVKYAKRSAYGVGNYFSEFPDISLGYGNGLLLCKILPGNEFVDSTNRSIPAGYHSKKVNPDHNDCGDMMIVANSDQILPCYVLHLR